MSLQSPTALVDLVIDAYVEWREASDAVRCAYAAWSGARGQRRAAAFDTYAAALDREERAAEEYRRHVERAHTLATC